jgi:hypothetical protein
MIFRILFLSIFSVFLSLNSISIAAPAAGPALRLLVQEGTSSSGESEYSSKKYQQLATVLGTYLKREIQVTGLSPLRQYDADAIRQGDILIARPNAVAGMAIQTLGFVPVVPLIRVSKVR